MVVSEVVFACHSKACAPPPVGTGGSRSSGGGRGGPKKVPGGTAAWNEALNRSRSGEKLTRGQIREIWTRNTKGDVNRPGGIGGGGAAAKGRIKDKSNDTGLKTAKGAGSDKSNDTGIVSTGTAKKRADEALGTSLSGKKRATERYTSAYQAGKALPDSVKEAIKADKTYKVLNDVSKKYGDHAGDGFADGVHGWKTDSGRYRPNGLRKNEKDLIPGEKGYRRSPHSTDRQLYGQ